MTHIVDFKEKRTRMLREKSIFPDKKQDPKSVSINPKSKEIFVDYVNAQDIRKLGPKGILFNFLSDFNINLPAVFSLASWFAQGLEDLEEMVVDRVVDQDYLNKFFTFNELAYYRSDKQKDRLIDWLIDVSHNELIDSRLFVSLIYTNSYISQRKITDEIIKRDYYNGLFDFISQVKYPDLETVLRKYLLSDITQEKVNQIHSDEVDATFASVKIVEGYQTLENVNKMLKLLKLDAWVLSLKYLNSVNLQAPVVNAITSRGKYDDRYDENLLAADALEYVKDDFLQSNIVNLIYKNKSKLEYRISDAAKTGLKYVTNKDLRIKLMECL